MRTVYVSSTTTDLNPYRQAARDVVLDLGWHPGMMEHFGAGSTGIVETCKQNIAKADLVVMIVAWRLGWIPGLMEGGDGKQSIVKIEFETAKEMGKPVIALLANDQWPGSLWEDKSERRDQIKALREGIDRLAVFFGWEPVETGTSELLPQFRAKVRQELLRYWEPDVRKRALETHDTPTYPNGEQQMPEKLRLSPVQTDTDTSVSTSLNTPSVAAVLSRAAKLGNIQPFELVRELLIDHREYGAGQGGEVGLLPGPTTGLSKTARAWVAEVQALFDPERMSRLHGRLLIVGLAHLDPVLAEYLESQDGFLSALRSELKEPFESLLLQQAESETPAANGSPGLPPTPPPINDPTPLHLDSPAIDDRLGRRGFARALAIRLERIWREMNPQDRSTDRPIPQGSFVLHLHGPWGSGKSSILEMLRRELRPVGQPAAPTVASPWVVVDFNAWQNQRLDPPWWPLLDGIHRQSLRQLPWWRTAFCWVLEARWRFSTKWRELLNFTFVVLIVGVLGYYFLRPTLVTELQKPLGEAGNIAENVTNILGLLTLVGGWLWLGSRSVISGSARAAQSFLDSAADPMDRIQRHFQKMVRAIDRPVAVFVDDLDRCQASYVVQLLEGIQTLFRDPRVVYVIAADQRWLHACFEKTYEAFAESVREPGRRLGSLFLEKAFEISIALPELSPGTRAEYWRFLLGGDPAQADQRLAAFEQEARAEFRHDRSEQQVVARLDESQGEADAADPLRAQARRQVAVEQLASAAVEQSVSYFLQPFAPLLEPNPRSMKRLLNAYAIRRDLAILSGLDVLAHEGRRKKLALWTILALRWPALEDFLREKAGGDDSVPSAEVAALLSSREVAEVVEGHDLGGPLTLDDLKELLGFGTVAAERPQ